MTEQELFNEYRKSNCKSFSDFLINKIAKLEKEKDKAWWEGFDTCKAKAGEANVKLNDELEKLKKQLEELPDKWCRNKDDYCPHLAKLEKENAELKADNDARKFAMAMSEKVEKQLREEITELKGIKDVATLIRVNNDTVTTLMQLNNKLVSKSQQLTKAKELIEELASSLSVVGECGEEECELINKAQKFINKPIF